MKTMKKTIFAILVVVLALVSCDGKKDVNYALVSGKITNPNSNEVVIIKDRKLVKKMTLTKDGTFKDTIFNANGYYTFSDSRETTVMYLEDGFDVKITIDTKQFDETVTYSGVGEKANNYLAKKLLKEEKEMPAAAKLYALDETAFVEKLNTFKSGLEADLKSVGGDFAKKEKKALNYKYAVDLGMYEGFHSYVTKNRDFKVSDKFPNPLKDMDLTNEKDFEDFDSYKSLVISDFYKKNRKEAKEAKKDIIDVSVEKIKNMKDGVIKNALIASLSREIRDGGERSKKIYNAVMELSKDDDLKKGLKTKMERFGKLAKGNPSPTFENYENYKGGKISLKDFKGKYVYIDVWATWCGPCKRQIPFMKKVEEKYHKSKNIAFVSISVDKLKDKETWKKMVKEKEMTGIQLFADKSFNSDFIQNYEINSIPRFILIDPEGNIVSSNAPRPSDPQLIELFKKQGIR